MSRGTGSVPLRAYVCLRCRRAGRRRCGCGLCRQEGASAARRGTAGSDTDRLLGTTSGLSLVGPLSTLANPMSRTWYHACMAASQARARPSMRMRLLPGIYNCIAHPTPCLRPRPPDSFPLPPLQQSENFNAPGARKTAAHVMSHRSLPALKDQRLSTRLGCTPGFSSSLQAEGVKGTRCAPPQSPCRRERHV